MKILLYNWAGIDGKSGGGVNVYVKNIIPGLLKKGHDIVFLNSGVKYTKDNKLKIVKLSEVIKGCQRYEIINSPVLAPAHSMFNHLERTLKNTELRSLFVDFCKQHNFDVIHFNNIEGLSLDILSTKKDLNSKFIYTIHNYNVVCPQVNLWKNESKNCTNHNNFKDCLNCVYPNDINQETTKRICTSQNIVIRGLRSFYRNKIKKKFFKKIKQNTSPEKIGLSPDIYEKYINESIKQINENIDLIISVSKRTHDVVCKRGIRDNNHKVVYIGTKFAEKMPSHPREQAFTAEDTILSIAYLGYVRHDKGYYYLIWLLENLPEYLAKHINFTVAARYPDDHELYRLMELEKRLNSLKYYNGYTHETLPEILKNTELGIVPVLWEDCLPQVAIEFVCHGIPILSSDLGGAQEIGNNPNFVYISKDKNSFEEKIASFIYNKNRLNTFWDTFTPPKTIEKHVEELDSIYSKI